MGLFSKPVCAVSWEIRPSPASAWDTIPGGAPVAEEPAETTQADGGVTEAVDVKSGEKEEAAGALDAANPASAIEKAADSSKKMIIVCVAAAAVIALTAGVSIALIKKKKGANGNTDGTDE